MGGNPQFRKRIRIPFFYGAQPVIFAGYAMDQDHSLESGKNNWYVVIPDCSCREWVWTIR